MGAGSFSGHDGRQRDDELLGNGEASNPQGLGVHVRIGVGVAANGEVEHLVEKCLAGVGTLPLDPSQAVRHGREIEARSASSCCDKPVRVRAARKMPPVISTIVMLKFFARR